MTKHNVLQNTSNRPFKKTVIITIPKPNIKQSQACNYISIALLPDLGKTFENILKQRLKDHVSHNIHA